MTKMQDHSLEQLSELKRVCPELSIREIMTLINMAEKYLELREACQNLYNANQHANMDIRTFMEDRSVSNAQSEIFKLIEPC
jgi:hypothetical protein